MDSLTLAADFPAVTREQWRALVDGVLKGADFEKRLVSRTYDGIRIEPLYDKAEPAPQPWRESRGRWRVAQRLDHPDPKAANELALSDLAGGADSLTLVWSGAPSARGFGLVARSVDDLDAALSGVMLDLVHVRLEAAGRGRQAAALFVALAERRGHRLSDLSVDLGLDPIGAMAATGALSAPWETVAARCAETLTGLAASGFAGRAFLADGRPYHEAGGSEAQELAGVLGTGVAYLRALAAGGHDLEAARGALAFLLAADADEFLTVAKFRALRRLWARIEEACGLEAKPIRLYAETAWRMTTRRDPWVNMLRGTIAAFSAGIGGADAITVLPFTAALGLPDAFARRVARNAQLILLEEAHVARVADPVSGAGGFEALTEALCETAWRLFQEIEAEGGIVESLRRGALQKRIAAVRAERERAIATRRDPITGVSEFPDIREAPVSVLLPFPSTGGPSHATAGGEPVTVAPLPSFRASEAFEQLRDRSDARLAATGMRPRVFLANLGTPAAFTARATFAKNFFEAGGIEAIGNDGFPSLDDMVAAFRASGARLACLCSSDEVYGAEAAAAADALKAAGAARLCLAGRPAELKERLQEAGVDTFIFVGCDAVQILRSLYEE